MMACLMDVLPVQPWLWWLMFLWVIGMVVLVCLCLGFVLGTDRYGRRRTR